MSKNNRRESTGELYESIGECRKKKNIYIYHTINSLENPKVIASLCQYYTLNAILP